MHRTRGILSESGKYVYGVVLGAVVTGALIVDENILVPKTPEIRALIDHGMDRDQLTAAFKAAAPDIINREIKRLSDSCGNNEQVSPARGVDCAKLFQILKLAP